MRTNRIVERGRLVAAALLALPLAGCPGSRSDFDVAAWRLSAAGLPDSAFGAAGQAMVRVDSLDDRAFAAATRPDGGVVIAGESHDGRELRGAVVALRADGTPAFVLRLPGGTTTRFTAVASTADGGVVAAGDRWAGDGGSEAFMTRLRPDGTVDSAFARGGTASLGLGPQGGVVALAAAADGAWWVAGTASPGDAVVARILPDGRRDERFGSGGVVHTAWTLGEDAPVAVLATGGGVLAAGATGRGWALSRFDRSGARDLAFGREGVVRLDWDTPNQRLAALLPRPRGGALLVGDVDAGVALAAFDAAGRPDSTFGTAGRAIVPIGDGEPSTRAATLDADGRVVVAAERVTHEGSVPVALRLTPAGAVDAGFGAGGVVTVPVASALDFPHVRVVLLDAGGRIILVGQG